MEKPQKIESNIHSPLTGGHRWNDWLPYAMAINCIAKGLTNNVSESRTFAEDRLYFILNEMRPISVLSKKNEDLKKYIESLTDENEILRVEHYDALVIKMLEEIGKFKEICKDFIIKSRKNFKDEEIKSYEIQKNDEEVIKAALLKICKLLDEVSYFLYDKENNIESEIQKILS